jgi:hypothetical protein
MTWILLVSLLASLPVHAETTPLEKYIEQLEEIAKPPPPDDTAVVRELNDIEDAIIIQKLIRPHEAD